MDALTFRRLLGSTGLMACSVAAAAVGIPGRGTWQGTLEARDLDRNGSTDAWYDRTLGITWLASAQAAAGSSFDTADGQNDGRLSVAAAQAWLASLNAVTHLGGNGWRLPRVSPVGGGAFATNPADPRYALQYTFVTDGSTDLGYAPSGTGWGTASELGHMYYVTLGNPNQFEPGWNPANLNTGPFTGVDASFFWSGTAFAPSPASHWLLNFNDGAQIPVVATLGHRAWAVHDGDLAGPAGPFRVPAGGEGPLLLLLVASGLAGGRRWAKWVPGGAG